MYIKKDNNIEISITPSFGIKESDDFVWSCDILVKNHNDYDITIYERFWKIIDIKGNIKEVKGYSVNEFTIIKSLESYEYMTYINMDEPAAMMCGYYLIKSKNSEKLIRAELPALFLTSTAFLSENKIKSKSC